MFYVVFYSDCGVELTIRHEKAPFHSGKFKVK